LLSGLAVYGAARRARGLRAGPLPLFPMHPRPTSLLSTPRFWHSLFCPQLYNASIVLFITHRRKQSSTTRRMSTPN
jgi:hypothetical protein